MAYQQPTPFVAPRLTLHIEAATLEELMAALDQVMGQLNPDHVSAVRYDQDRPAVDVDVHGSKDEADAAAAAAADTAAKRGRGRPRKDAVVTTPAPTAAQEAEDDDIHHIAMTALPAAPVADASAMQNLTPADARKKGIDLITTHFAKNPACLPQVQQVSAKYGVGQFADVPDAQAHAFLADISLLISGAGQV